MENSKVPNHPVSTLQSSFLQACHCQPTDVTPVWFMRQAGRYMPEYRAIREKYSLIEICHHPEIAAEVTLQPVHALGVDAAILFADILLPAIPLGVGLEFAKGEGPVLQNPVRTMEDVKNLRPVHPESDLGYVMDAIRILRGELTGVPLIGFCGAPFTVASYIIEGGSSREFLKTKAMMYSAPEVWHALMEKLSVVLSDYLVAQIHAGAQTVQVFDSWVGALNPQDYEEFVFPYSQKILQDAKKENVPVIHFGTNTTTLLPLMKRAGGDCSDSTGASRLTMAGNCLATMSLFRETSTPRSCSLPCLRSRNAFTIFWIAPTASLVISLISDTAFCKTLPLTT